MRTYGQRRSQLQERRVADELGGETQKASGAMPHAKGDVRVRGELRVECKTTRSKQFTLKLSDLAKIHGEALSGGLEFPAMCVEFEGQGGHSKRYAVIDWEWFRELAEGTR